jgi:geranylgeranyl diphosphate/geranylgeranyl-bacteriochlorophyllide a reductase
VRREILDGYLRERAIEFGASAINGLVTQIDIPAGHNGKYKIHYQHYKEGSKIGTKVTTALAYIYTYICIIRMRV